MVPDSENYRKVNCFFKQHKWEFVMADLFNFEIREQVITDKHG